jgi:hypothetical protein
MSAENRSDVPSAKGAPAPQQSETRKVTPFPSIPAPSVPKPDPEYDPAADEDGIEITEADFEGAVGHDENRILKRSNAKRPSSWVQGPGQVEALVEACKLLKWAAKAAGTPMSEIEAVIVKALPKVNQVLVAAAKSGAPGSIETWKSGHGAISFTISDILREAGMQVATGTKHLFPVKKVITSPIGPAIAINMGAKPLETRHVNTKQKKRS